MSQAASITWPSTPRGSASCRQARQRDRRRRRPSGREIGRPDQQSERATGRRVYHRARLDRRGQRGRRVGAVSPRHRPQTSEDLALSDDVDNIRIDPTTGNIIVGYGNGALAIIDPQDEVEGRRHHAFWASRSLPGRAQDTPRLCQRAGRSSGCGGGPRCRKADGGLVNIGLRVQFSDGPRRDRRAACRGLPQPPTLAVLDEATWAITKTIGVCGDGDEVFFDAKRSRFHVSCGEGAIDILNYAKGRLERMARMTTSRGARTAIYAAILVFRPSP